VMKFVQWQWNHFEWWLTAPLAKFNYGPAIFLPDRRLWRFRP
jgi:hypothetical protein